MGMGWVSSSIEGGVLRGYCADCALFLGLDETIGGLVCTNGWAGGGGTGFTGLRCGGDTGFGCGLPVSRLSGIVGGAFGYRFTFGFAEGLGVTELDGVSAANVGWAGDIFSGSDGTGDAAGASVFSSSCTSDSGRVSRCDCTGNGVRGFNSTACQTRVFCSSSCLMGSGDSGVKPDDGLCASDSKSSFSAIPCSSIKN